jgi:hypothetical protein
MKKYVICFLILMTMAYTGTTLSNAEDRTRYTPDTRFDQYGGWKEIKSEATGFFRIQKIDGTWWFITPDGYGFLSVGINTLNHKGDFSPKLGYSPYQRNVERKYGSAIKWSQVTLGRLKGWTFNTIGGFGHPFLGSLRKLGEKFPYIITLNFGDLGGANWQKGIFPDVFKPEFKEKVYSFVKSRCDKLNQDQFFINQDPFLIGYFTDNELHWHNAVRSLWIANGPGKKAIIDFLRDRCQNDFSKFKSVWETTASSFDDLIHVKELIPRQGALSKAREDEAECLRIVARKYFEITIGAIRSCDRNHLILGCRFFPPTPRSVVEEIGHYVDVVSVNYYPKEPNRENTEEYKKWDAQMAAQGMITGREWLKEYSALSKRPILITEFSLKAKDSGLPNTKGGGLSIAVPSQKDRADMFEWFAKESMKTSYTVGYHWFKYMDDPKEGRFDGGNSNLGLVDIQDNPYYPLVERMRVVNREIYSLHKGK